VKSNTRVFLASLLALASSLNAATPPFAAEAGVDLRIHPGDDFFAYANGAWLQDTTIPAGSGRWNARDEIRTRTQQQLTDLLDESVTAPAGSAARMVADFRAAYLDEANIEARGLDSLKEAFADIDAIGDKAALTRLLGRELRADVDPLNLGVYNSAQVLGLSVEPGSLGEKNYAVFLLQGGLGLPDREHYLSSDPAMQALCREYQQHIAQQLSRAGFAQSAVRAAAVFALETAIARSHASAQASAEESNAERLWSRADFRQQAPGMDWSAFFEVAGLSAQERLIVWQPSAVIGLAALAGTQPLAAWRDYLRWRTIDLHADVLPRAFSDAALAFRGRMAKSPAAARAQRAAQSTQQALSGVIGRVYVEKHFPAAQKTRVQTIARNVIVALQRRVDAATWLSPSSRAQAQAKLDAVYFGVGYPEAWPNYSNLIIDPKDAPGNLRRVARWNTQSALAKIGRPADLAEWWIAPQSPGALLLFHQNSYNFAAALLQPPKFDPAASDASNYGAIGAIVGHEASHFIDTLGADYDVAGRKSRWWGADDAANYQAATEPLVRQFSAYRPLPDQAVDGQLTLVENLADLAGLLAAFDAHRQALGERVRDSQFVRQQDRQFFLGFARSWRAQYREDALRTLLTSDTHAPEAFRIATVRNLDAWYVAFDVGPMHKLYLAPADRVRIW
jgi:putative endopeptidase